MSIIKMRVRTYILQFLCLLFFSVLISLNHKVQELSRVTAEFEQYKFETQIAMQYFNQTFDNIEENYKRDFTLERELTCLAMNVYFESGNKSYQEKLAIAIVTMNRVNNDNYPKTICGVVWEKRPHSKKCQFAWTCDGKSDRIIDSGKYFESLQVAKEVLINSKKSSIIDKEVIYFHANYIKPEWSKHMVYVASIGTHVFYKERVRRYNGNARRT